MIAYGDRDKDILSHILEYCKQIDEFLLRYENSSEMFASDVLFRYAVSMAEFQIGELTGHLSDEFKEKTKDEIPWKQIRGMRNIFAHNYTQMDIRRLWNTAINDIPYLRNFCEAQLDLFDKADK